MSILFSLSLSVLTAVFPGVPGLAGTIINVSILDFIGAKVDGGGGNNWSYMVCGNVVQSFKQETVGCR